MAEHDFLTYILALDKVKLAQVVDKAQEAFWAKVETKGLTLISDDSFEKAMDAFWHEVAEAYPKATGDYPPDITIAFENVCRVEAEFKLLGTPKTENWSFNATCKSAVQWWLYYNLPE